MEPKKNCKSSKEDLLLLTGTMLPQLKQFRLHERELLETHREFLKKAQQIVADDKQAILERKANIEAEKVRIEAYRCYMVHLDHEYPRDQIFIVIVSVPVETTARLL